MPHTPALVRTRTHNIPTLIPVFSTRKRLFSTRTLECTNAHARTRTTLSRLLARTPSSAPPFARPLPIPNYLARMLAGVHTCAHVRTVLSHEMYSLERAHVIEMYLLEGEHVAARHVGSQHLLLPRCRLLHHYYIVDRGLRRLLPDIDCRSVGERGRQQEGGREGGREAGREPGRQEGRGTKGSKTWREGDGEAHTHKTEIFETGCPGVAGDTHDFRASQPKFCMTKRETSFVAWRSLMIR